MGLHHNAKKEVAGNSEENDSECSRGPEEHSSHLPAKRRAIAGSGGGRVTPDGHAASSWDMR